MASLRTVAPTASGLRVNLRSAKSVLPVRRSVRALAVRAQAGKQEEVGFQVGRVAAMSSVAATWMLAGNANAATELATLAANDNRLGLLLTLFAPALGWVAFNIFGPAKAQLDQMDSKRAVPAAVGLGAAASLLLAQSAEASTELATIAASDNRLGLIATLFVPALGWVAFNIFGAAKAQLDKMSDDK